MHLIISALIIFNTLINTDIKTEEIHKAIEKLQKQEQHEESTWVQEV